MKMQKKLVIGLTSLALTAAVAVGGTMALMTAKTNEANNVFTVGGGANGLTGELKEPLFDHVNFSIDPEKIPDGHVKGSTMATNFTAGTVIDKDPAVLNTTTPDTTPDKPDDQKSSTAWVAIKLEYTGEANSYAAIDKFAEIAFNTQDWVAKDATNTVFYYKVPLAAGQKTTPLFNKVTIDRDAIGQSNQAADLTKLMKSFNIKATGYMVQRANVADLDAAKTAFHDAYGI
jgi:hypothetical protein